MQNGANFGFFGPVRFRGHFEELAITKVLLNTKPRRVGKFRGCRFSDVCESVAREEINLKKTAVKYNCSLALDIARAGDHNAMLMLSIRTPGDVLTKQASALVQSRLSTCTKYC